jgi:integrase/recombinase XerD
MKRKVTLQRFFHRDKMRIGIFFDYDEKLKSAVRSIPGSLYSGSNRCFYVDDSEENLKMVLRGLKDVAETDITPLTKTGKKTESSFLNPEKVSHEAGPVSRNSNAGKEKNEEPHLPVKIITAAADKVEVTRDNINNNGIRYSPVEFRISEKEGLLVIKFLGRYDDEWIKELRTYEGCRYDTRRREWLLTWSKITCDSLADYFAMKGIAVNIKKQVVNEALKSERKSTSEEIRAKELGKKALDGLDLLAIHLDENRYSPRTRETYLSALDFYFRYFSPEDPMEITEDEISLFIYDYIIRLGYSASYQNQMVSAIKTFYLISGKGKVNPDFLERPRRSRALPKVFSKEEVSMILNSARNSKHKLLLWLIYSCGLRRSEVTNIRLSDLDRERSIIHIREGKGRVDRIVPVSAKVWDKMDEYMSSYKPREYVFEGQTGGRYSSESVYHVFKDALLRAGINKDVGVHSLRHSYATHLHENGLDIRYIQELLGHKSTRTTEIYTHVSRRNLIAVRSPIDDLDVK